MSPFATDAQNDSGCIDLPDSYERLDQPQPTWRHRETGLLVQLRRDSRPSGRRLDRTTAMQSSDECWTFAVRPGAGERADPYEPLGGDKDGAISHARDWMAAHPDGAHDV